jgi:phosphoglycolate phosphatase
MIHVNRPIPANKLRLFIFDLDGTLIDSRVDLANSVNAMLRHLERPELPQDVIASYIGDGAPMLVRRALGDPDDNNLVARALEYFLLHYREHKLDTTYVYRGMKEALAAIRESPPTNGRSLAVLTNKPVNASRQIVQGLGLGDYFVQVYGGNSFETKKPDPLGAITLMKEAGAQPEETVIIGDSDVDVLTGRNAHLWTCGVRYGFAPHTLDAALPDVVVDHPQELAELFSPKIQKPVAD